MYVDSWNSSIVQKHVGDMTLIEGVGDEVTHFFIAVFIIVIVSIAWWTTSISEHRHVRTVLLLERTRHRTHRRLTTNTEAVTITEGTSNALSTDTEEPSTSSQTVSSNEMVTPEEKPPDSTSNNSPIRVGSEMEVEEAQQLNLREEETIISTMDADNCVLRQRRLAFYTNISNGNQDNTEYPQCAVHPSETSQPLPSTSSREVHQVTDCLETNDTCSIIEKQESFQSNNLPNDQNGITIKLKYINDDVKLVDGKLDEMLGDFKKRHFQTELAGNKLVRLIFNGQVLQPDSQTLQGCGLFDNCVVHCLVHQKRPASSHSTVVETRRGGYSFPNTNGLHNLNNNNPNRDWDLGNFLFAFISFILLAAWYFRYVYAHLYTVTATVGLILMTGIFTIVLVGMYFPPDNENLPNPTIRIARERVQIE